MLKKSIRFLSVLTIFGVFLALMTTQGAPSSVASAQSEHPRAALTWTVPPGSPQMDMGLISGYQASEPFSADSALDEAAPNLQAEGDTAVLAGASADSEEGQVVTNLANLPSPDSPAITTGEPNALTSVVGSRNITETKLTASDGAENGGFGGLVSISGDAAIVSGGGSAYIYRWNGSVWQEQAKLTASDGTRFGSSVSIDQNVAIVGVVANHDNGRNSGAAYIYRLRGSQWQEESKLTASDAAPWDNFGNSVSIDGDVALVGAQYDSVSSGSAYIYRWDGSQWQEESKLLASDGAQGDTFGSSVSIDGDVALVGALGDSGNGSYTGSAYIYRWDGTQWQEESKLLASDGAQGNHFGESVSIDGNVALVGASRNENNGNGVGSAYIYRWDGTQWQEESKLLANDGASTSFFGRSVSIDSDVALVGTYYDDDNGALSGSAYIYRWDGTQWEEESKLLASDGAVRDYFGWSVSIDGNIAFVGAPGEDGNGVDSGAVYVYDLSSGPDIEVSPASISVTLGEGESSTETLEIRNTGTSNLDWQVNESATWLTVASTSGTVAPDSSASVTVGVDASGLSAGTYTDRLTITSNDPDQPSIEVPVSLVVGSLNIPEFKLTASDGAAGDQFGFSVSIDGDVALVGSSADDDNGTDSGAAYIYRWDGSQWHLISKLLPSDGAQRDGFGSAVSIDGNVALVGASGGDSAYIYRWDGSQWHLISKLLPSDGAQGGYFGNSVSIDGDVALVGNGSWRGSAYVYRWDGNQWQEEGKLLASDGFGGQYFGLSVSIDGDVAFVGAPWDNDNGEYSGSVYIYRWDGNQWQEESKLLPSDGARGDEFGRSVSINGDVALVGAYGNDDQGSDSGAAYIYRWDGSQWQEESKLLASDGAQNGTFGYSVSLDSNVALVGTLANNSAYVYRWDGSQWQEESKLLPSDGVPEDFLGFGFSVSVSGNTALVGAPPFLSDGSGSAYVYDLPSPPDDPEVTPRYGLNDGPSTLYIYGNGFSDSSTVKLGSELLEVNFVMLDEDPQRIRAVVPADVTPGTYDVTVETGSDSVTLPNGYEVLDAGITDDLLSEPEWLWTNPIPMRVGYSDSSVGLLVQHLGGTTTVDAVTVEFRLGGPDGEVLGRALTNLLAPDATESTMPVTWEPTEPSDPDGGPIDYTVCAIIDPDNAVEETKEDNNVICQTITVLPPHFGPGECLDPNDPECDTEPPEVDSFAIDNNAPSTNQQAVRLDMGATEYPLDNPSGMNAVRRLEFEYIHGARRWVPVKLSDWEDYDTLQSDYDWELVPSYGMRYMQAWASDNNQNISLKPGVDVIDLLPTEQADTVGRNGVVVYRILLEEGERFAATMTPESGDPNMYVWLQNGTLQHNVNPGAETVEFDAPLKGTYQIEIHGPSSGSADYRLIFGTSRGAQMDDPTAHSRRSPERVPDKPAVPLDEWPEYYDVGIPPVAPEYTIYLPISIR